MLCTGLDKRHMSVNKTDLVLATRAYRLVGAQTSGRAISVQCHEGLGSTLERHLSWAWESKKVSCREQHLS